MGMAVRPCDRRSSPTAAAVNETDRFRFATSRQGAFSAPAAGDSERLDPAGHPGG
jgi:hypothetical protein